MSAVINIIETTTELGIEVVEVVVASSSTPGPAGPGVPTGGTDGQVLTKASATDFDTAWEDSTGGGGGGAPTTVDYLVGTASGDLSAEIVVGTTPGGELGGTWASPTVDATHSGSSHAGVQAAAEATAAAALSAHEADTTSVHGIANTANLYSVGGTDVAIADGGTGASTAAGARANLDLEAGTDFPSLATFNDHSARHENGGADEISLAGLDGTPTALQTHLDDTSDAHDASAISVADVAGDYTATDVEGVLAEIAPQLGGSSAFVGARARDTDGQTITTGTLTAVNMDAEDLDTTAFHDNATNNTRLTVPSGQDGIYEAVASLNWPVDSVGIRMVRILKNGSTNLASNLITPVTAEATLMQVVSGPVSMVAGDYVECIAYHTKGSNLALDAGSWVSLSKRGT